ncbi:MAG: glycosyltransferase [Bacteriovoracaceae bacterium]
MSSSKFLLTTSDYLPKLGGLTSYTLNFEKVFKDLEIDYELLNWKERKIEASKLDEFQMIFNVHYLGGYFLKLSKTDVPYANFIHGSEILFTSPNPLKKFVKRLLKRPQLDYLENAKYNFFISAFTYEKLCSLGYRPNYARDIILPNCIETSHSEFHKKTLEKEVIKVCCIARDVPHKNIDGVITFCELLQEISEKEVELTLSATRKSSKLTIHSLEEMTDEKREQVYKESHLNLLLSLDHSHLGFYEGFGLSILEGNCYGVPGVVFRSGGLSENVHDQYNGIVLDSIDRTTVSHTWEILKNSYENLSKNAFDHVKKEHGLDRYKDLVKMLLREIG